MSSGNGLLGMSLAAPVFVDTVHRLRPGSVALAFDGAATPSLRQPSTRPIDQRWDRSRGLVFSNAARPVARDHSWSRAHGIIFGHIPASTRSYALDPRFTRKKPAATSAANNATTTESSVDSPHRSVGFVFSQVEGNKLRNENSDLKDEVKDQEATIEELKRHGIAQQEKIKQMTADFELHKSKLEQKRQADKSELERELRTQKQLVADLEPSRQNLERNRVDAHEKGRRQAEAEMRKQHDEHIRELKAQYAKQIATIEENSQVIREAKRQNALLVIQHEQERRQHEEAIKKVQAAVKSAETEAEEHKHKSNYLQQQYLGRQRRARTDRDNYASYRNVFDDMSDAAYTTMSRLLSLVRQLQSEARLWRRSATTFQNAKQLHLFRQQDRYNAIKKSINDFLEARAAHAEQGENDLRQLATQLRTEVQTANGPAHNSRLVTRLLHFDEHTAYDLADTAYHIAMVLPFRQRREECDSRIQQVKAEIAADARVSQGLDPTLRQELATLLKRRSALSRLLQVFEVMRRLKAYEALLQDTAVEKAVFMRTTQAFEDVVQVQAKYMGLFDEIQTSSDETGISAKERANLRQSYREDEGKARRALDELQDLARNRCVLEQDLGQLTSVEQVEADREIQRRITRLVEQQNDLVDHLVPSMRSMGRQTRASSIPASQPIRPPSMEDMKSKPAGSVSAAKSTKVAPISDLTLAFRTPSRKRTSGQKLMVLEARVKKKQRAFLQNISPEAVPDDADEQALDMLGLSRRIARLEPRVQPANAERSLRMWEDILRPYKLLRKTIASLPNADPGTLEAHDETMTAIARNIAHLKSKIKAGQISDVVPSDSHNAAPGTSTNGVSIADLGVKAESVKLPSDHANGDSNAAQGSTAPIAASSSDNAKGLLMIAPRRKPLRRRERVMVGKHASGSTSMESLIKNLGAKTGGVSGGISASASSGGLNLKPTSPKRSQLSLFTTRSFDVRGIHHSTILPGESFTATTSDADSLSHLQEADLHAIDEAFSTMPDRPPQPTTSQKSTLPAERHSGHHTRNTSAMPAMMSSASVQDDLPEDGFSDCSPSVASSIDSSESSESHPPPPQLSDANVNLAYNIPARDYRAAVMASPNSSTAFWSHRLYKDANGKRPVVFYCKGFEAAERQARLFASEQVLGFDLEWEPQTSIKSGNIKRNVSLIQIATEDKIALFHIALFRGETAEELMPPTLKTILESADVVKAGVNVLGDARRMRELLNIDMKGVFELSHLYRVVKYSEQDPKNVTFRLVGLAAQVQDILMLPLKKDDNRMSAWSRELNTQQTDYAASDAYAGFRLFHKLDDMRRSMSPTPPRPGFLEQDLPLMSGDGTKVYKSTWKPSGRKTTAVNKDATVEEEEDEFFDAVEDQDADDLTAKMDSLNIARDDGTVTSTTTYPALPQIQTAETAEDVNVASGAEVNQDDAPSKRGESTRQRIRPDTAELKAADAWVADWRFSLPPDWTVSARPFELRAYHLWHHQGFALKEVAALCREPPLALPTVASYVMQALKEENLPYDPERVRDPRDILPTSVHRRYQKIFDRIPK